MKRDGGGSGPDPGDDSCVLRFYAAWVPSMEIAIGGSFADAPTVHARRDANGTWELGMSVPRGDGRRQRHFIAFSPDAVKRPNRWNLVKLAPRVWDMPASVHVPGQMHAFITLLGVPDPAPWEVP